jgi:O-antigen/teichoic acid export membrane protein
LEFVKRLLNKSFSDYLQVIFGTAVGRGTAFLNAIIIARTLGPEQFGIFAFFFAVMMLVCLSLSSFDTAYIRHAKVATSKNNKRELLFSNLIIKTALGLIIAACVVVMTASTATEWFGKTYARSMILVGISAGIFMNWVMTLATFFREREKFHLFTIVANVHSLIILICLVCLWGLRGQLSLKSVLSTYLLSAFSVGFLSLIVVVKIGHPRRPGWLLLRTYVSWGKWMLLLSLAVAIFDRMDFFFLTKYLQPGKIGIYAAGVQIVLIISVTTGALNNVLVPRAVVALTSRRALRCYVRESVVPVSMIVSLIAMLFIAAPLLINGLYGQEFTGAIIVVRIIAVGWFGATLYLPFSFLFYALDEPHTRFYLELTKLILGFSALTLLVPLYGIRGGALAVSLSLLLNALLSGLVLWFKLKQPSLYAPQQAESDVFFPAKEGS